MDYSCVSNIYRQDSVAGFNLPNNNVSAVSLARKHLEMKTSSLKIGVQCKPPACSRRFILDPNFSGFGPDFQMRPCQTHGIPPISRGYMQLPYHVLDNTYGVLI